MLEVIGGWDARESLGFDVCKYSLVRRTSQPLRVVPLMEKVVRFQKLYWRPHEERDGRLWCPISQAHMSTAFANSRFLVPFLAHTECCLFLDCADMLALGDVAELFALSDPRYAVQVVKREFVPEAGIKMDGQVQTKYARKNWSSVVLWNLAHPGHMRLTIEMVNKLPGRDLHRFCWLEDDEIGELPREWNHLVGIDPPTTSGPPKLLHFTEGAPFMHGYENQPWADVWRLELAIMAADHEGGRLWH